MITLHNDNCFNILKTLENNSIDMVLTDIPYDEVNRPTGGIRVFDKGKADVMVGIDVNTLMTELIRITKGSIYIFCGIGQISDIHNAMKDAGMSTRLGCWEKTNPSPVNGEYLWVSGLEYAVFGRKANATFTKHCEKPIWLYPSGQSNIHPTQKPLKLFEYLIEASSKIGDTVLDPFMGSGTTGEASKTHNRNFIGIELDKHYFEIASDRINNTLSVALLPDDEEMVSNISVPEKKPKKPKKIEFSMVANLVE
jgi:site-specific DNA-methyltransferase (adenine-specific)